MFLFSISFSFDFINLSYIFGCDLLSFIIILLRIWICCLIILARNRIYLRKNYTEIFLFIIIILLITLVIVFCSLNLFFFYLFFEFILIPILIIIIGWGYQPERIQAGIYLLFYTIFGSLPIIISIFYFYYKFCSLNYFFLSSARIIYLYICFNFVFFIKAPLYLIHT